MRVALSVLSVALLAAAPAAAELVVISRADCARVVAHVPAPDVAYRPDIDARGRPTGKHPEHYPIESIG